MFILGLHKLSKKQVAIKVVQKKNMSTSQVEDMRDLISMYQAAQHSNVVRLEDYFECKEYFHLCLELHSDQTLLEYFLKMNQDINETKI